MERSEMFSATYTEIVPDTGRYLKLKLQINSSPRNGICIMLAAVFFTRKLSLVQSVKLL